MQKWEYKTIKVESKGILGGIVNTSALDELLNEYGRDGWNLVSVFDTNTIHGVSREIVAVFKREVMGKRLHSGS